MTQVDLSQLAIDRSASSSVRGHTRFRFLTRYVLPGTLLVSFLALMFWVSRDLIFPPQQVTVMPVIVTQSTIRNAGTPLFQAAGWVEPRPTPIRVAALSPGGRGTTAGSGRSKCQKRGTDCVTRKGRR